MSRPAEAKTTSREDLHDLVWSQPLGSVALRFGLTANGLAKLCDRLDIPRPARTYWSKPTGQRGPRTPLGPAPDGVQSDVVVGGDKPVVRRKRTRLSPADRQEQLLDTAAAIALSDGVQEISIKRVAREAGISEAQAHNCFQGRTDLLLALARRELRIVETKRRSRVARGHDRMASIVISTVSYLHEAVERGPLLQMLLRNIDVRNGLRAERAISTSRAREPSLQLLAERYHMNRSMANGSAAALAAVCLRAGGLLASGRTDLGTGERICLSIVIAGARSNEAWRES